MSNEWLPMEDAPRDGTVILGRYENEPDGYAVRWAESRRCMLAGIGGGNGYFREGWEDDLNHLIVDAPLAWKPIEKVPAKNKTKHHDT